MVKEILKILRYVGRQWTWMLLVVALVFVVDGAARAAPEVTLRFHHFLSPLSVFHRTVAVPWKEAVERDSDGRIAVRIFPSMQLGGKPNQLYDQVSDGVVDIIWTLPGYTPGRFPLIEVFELPFMVTNSVSTSAALQSYAQEYLQEEFGAVRPLFFFTHARGSLHTRGRLVRRMEDLSGLKIRAPGEIMAQMLAALGATPVGMPVTQVVPSLGRGVIDGALLPFQVMLPLGAEKLATNTTTIAGDRGLYTATFLVAMNRGRYDSMPADLQAVVDRNSGLDWAIRSARRFWKDEQSSRQVMTEKGNSFYTLSDDEVLRWRQATSGVRMAWAQKVRQQGHDADAIIKRVEGLLKQYGDLPVSE